MLSHYRYRNGMAHKKFFTGKRLKEAEKSFLIDVLRLEMAEDKLSRYGTLGLTPVLSPLSQNLTKAIVDDFKKLERDLKTQDPVLWSLYLDEMNSCEAYMREVNASRRKHIVRTFQPADGYLAFHFDD